ncbi:hypothetical protein JGF37_23470 [Salmonella enterica subsp. enterica serovar Goldcoast]|nr:hypothetical protein [Salmonella enterica subsp. enterica serovar Goldcoast]
MNNRKARRLLGVDIKDTYRISNRRWLVWGSNYPFVWEHAKPSPRQKRKAKEVAAYREELKLSQESANVPANPARPDIR